MIILWENNIWENHPCWRPHMMAPYDQGRQVEPRQNETEVFLLNAVMQMCFWSSNMCLSFQPNNKSACMPFIILGKTPTWQMSSRKSQRSWLFSIHAYQLKVERRVKTGAKVQIFQEVQISIFTIFFPYLLFKFFLEKLSWELFFCWKP